MNVFPESPNTAWQSKLRVMGKVALCVVDSGWDVPQSHVFPHRIHLASHVLESPHSRVEIRHYSFEECLHIYTRKRAETMAAILSPA